MFSRLLQHHKFRCSRRLSQPPHQEVLLDTGKTPVVYLNRCREVICNATSYQRGENILYTRCLEQLKISPMLLPNAVCRYLSAEGIQALIVTTFSHASPTGSLSIIVLNVSCLLYTVVVILVIQLQFIVNLSLETKNYLIKFPQHKSTQNTTCEQVALFHPCSEQLLLLHLMKVGTEQSLYCFFQVICLPTIFFVYRAKKIHKISI